MKTFLLAALVMMGAVSMSACSIFGKDDKNDVGGSTDVSFAEAGDQLALGTITAGGQSVPVDAGISIISNDKGEGTARVQFNAEAADNSPGVQKIADYILEYVLPGADKDADGTVTADVRFKATSEGMLDYVYDEPFVIVKYDDPVGTKYTAKTPTGVTQTREVVSKSSTDDFSYGFQYIKVSKVEQQLNQGGVRKLTYYANHKFGLVYWEVSLDDGSTVGSYLYTGDN